MSWMYQRVFARHYNESVDLTTGHPASASPSFITPCGATGTHLFCAGALLERHGRKGEPMQARLADPTGAFELQIDRTNSVAADALESFNIPCFVTVTGDAISVGPKGSGRRAVRVRSIREVDRHVRDAWVLRTSELTIRRIERIRDAIISHGNDTITTALLTHHQVDLPRLNQMALMVKEALRVVDTSQEYTAPEWNPAAVILDIIREHAGKEGITIEEVTRKAVWQGMSAPDVEKIVVSLLQEDECYQPSRGVLKPL